jgi:hypothetical protein
MARKPTRKPRPASKASIKAAADRAEKRAKGEDIDAPRVEMDPTIRRVSEDEFDAGPPPSPRAGIGGRPTAYKQEYCQTVAELSLAGCTDEEIATELGVDVRTIYRWKATHTEFRQCWLWGKEEREAGQNERVERSLYARAVGYTYDAVKIFQNDGIPVIVPFKEHVPPDVGAGKLWLTNRKRSEWADTTRQEVSGPGGGPIQVEDVSKLDLARWIAHQLTQAQVAPKALEVEE